MAKTVASVKFTGLVLAAILACFALFVDGSSMAAWMTANGPSLVVYNATTGLIISSNCDNPSLNFANSPQLALETIITPVAGTSLTASGWVEDGIGWASIFYIDDRLTNIVRATYYCNQSTHAYQLDSNYKIPYTAGLKSFITSDTQLAVTLDSPSITTLAFTGIKLKAVYLLELCSIGCGNYSIISRDSRITGSALTIAGTGRGDLSVVTPKDKSNFEVITGNGRVWQIATAPQPLEGLFNSDKTPATGFKYGSETEKNFALPAWTGTSGALGYYVDESSDFEALFYVGSDHGLHGAYSSTQGSQATWQLLPKQNETIWPLADEPDSDFAMAIDMVSSTVFIYYMSGGRFVEVRGNSQPLQEDDWVPAVPVASKVTSPEALPVPVSIQSAVPTPTPAAAAAPGSSAEGKRLTYGQKCGLGIGLSFGTLIPLTVFIAIWHTRRQAHQEQNEKQKETQQVPWPPRRMSGLSLPRSSRRKATSCDNMSAHAQSPDGSLFINNSSDDDDDDTVLSERWNTKPGGPDFAHIKPYTEFGNLRWSSGSKHKKQRPATMSDVTVLVVPGSPMRGHLPTKSQTMAALPRVDSESSVDERKPGEKDSSSRTSFASAQSTPA